MRSARSFVIVIAVATALLAPVSTADGAGPTRYSVRLDGTPTIHVRVEWPPAAAGPVRFIIPRAVPMGYGEAPYDRFYANIRAFDPSGRTLDAHRDMAMGVAAPRFVLGGAESTVGAVEYEIDLAKLEREVVQAGDQSMARPRFVGLLGYSVFGFIEGQESEPVILDVEAPAAWPIFLTLAPVSGATTKASAQAESFYALADSQILAGPDLAVRKIDSVLPLYLATFSEKPFDTTGIARLADEAMRAVVDYFGTPPFAYYTLVEWRVEPLSPDHAYNTGMEHLTSMTSVQSLAGAPMEDRRRRLFYAHHMAHAWIPKRSYADGYFPFQWEFASLIDTIWFSEGFGQYAAIDALARSMEATSGAAYRTAVVDFRFRQALRETPPAVASLSLGDVSRIASSRYFADFRFGMNSFARGGLMAAEMDARILEASGGRKSLRDGMKALIAWSEREKRAFTLAELWTIVQESTGVDVTPIYERWSAQQPALQDPSLRP